MACTNLTERLLDLEHKIDGEASGEICAPGDCSCYICGVKHPLKCRLPDLSGATSMPTPSESCASEEQSVDIGQQPNLSPKYDCLPVFTLDVRSSTRCGPAQKHLQSPASLDSTLPAQDVSDASPRALRALQPRSRTSGNRTRWSAKRHTTVAAPLSKNLSDCPAIVIARQMIKLYNEPGGTFMTRTRLEHGIQRLEGSRALLLASEAVVTLLQSRLRTGLDRITDPHGLKQYTSAITELQSSLSASEPSLLAIHMLGHYDLLAVQTLSHHDGMEDHSVKMMKAHCHAIHSILLADPQKWSQNAIGKSILGATRLAIVEGSIAAGIPSPFEQDIWLDDHVNSHEDRDVSVLARSARQIFYKLPRLVSLFREIRAGNIQFTTLCETIAVTHQLLGIRNAEAYCSVLESCDKFETVSDVDRVIVPLSLYFETLEDYDDFLDYCRARLTITTLCLALQHLIPRYVAPQYEEVRQQQLDSLDSVLSCWQFCMGNQRFAKCMRNTFFPLYGALRQMDSYRGMPIDRVISWLEPKSVIAFSHSRRFRGEWDLAHTWDMYCGGPPNKSIFKQWMR